MVDNSHVNERIILDKINKELGKLFSQVVGTKRSIGLKKRLKTLITGNLESMRRRKIIKGFDSKDITVDTLWWTWGIKQKFRWYLANKIFKWLGEETREHIDERNFYAQVLWERIPEEDNEEGIYSEALQRTYPQWARPHPKEVVITNIAIKINRSVDYVTINLTIGEDIESNS